MPPVMSLCPWGAFGHLLQSLLMVRVLMGASRGHHPKHDPIPPVHTPVVPRTRVRLCLTQPEVTARFPPCQLLDPIPGLFAHPRRVLAGYL